MDEEIMAGSQEEHTSECPYCGNINCWCHTSVEYHDQVTDPLSSTTEEEVTRAYSFFGL